MKMLLSFLLPLALMFSACSKSSSGDSGSGSLPQTLNVNAVVNTNNSGDVAFTATAVNASTYRYEYGDGTTHIIPSGNVTYKYGASGTYTVKVFAINSAGSISKTLNVTVNVAAQTLLFSDEFNTPGAPDASKWNYDIGTGDNGWGNQELQYYTNRSENVIVENGVLKIKAIRENYNGSTFTSARLKTQGKFDFKYGKIEFSAKVPAGVGTWAAAWMLGSNITTAGWPACGEIDVMEHLGREENKIYGTFHYPGRSGGNADGNTKMITNATSEFHKYSAEWNATSIKIYVDGQLIHTLQNSSAVPFNHNHFIIMNLAMGGNFGGAVASTVNGATYEVDYVRVYAN